MKHISSFSRNGHLTAANELNNQSAPRIGRASALSDTNHMPSRRRLLALGATACIAGTLAACGGGGSGGGSGSGSGDVGQSLYDKLVADPDLSICKAVVDKAGFKDQLSAIGNQAITLLAPNNAAMQAYLAANPSVDAALNAPLLTPAQLTQLKQMVSYHLLANDVASASVTTQGVFLSTLRMVDLDSNDIEETPLSLHARANDVTNHLMLNGESRILSADTMASNGRLHTVDTVLPVPTLMTFLKLQFSKHASGILATPYGEILDQIMPGGFPFTLFVPTDDAWNDVWSQPLSELAADTLSFAMQAHTIAGDGGFHDVYLYSDLVKLAATGSDTAGNENGDEITPTTAMLAGQTALLLNTPYGIIQDIDEARVTQADIVAINGAMHELSSYLPVPLDAPLAPL